MRTDSDNSVYGNWLWSSTEYSSNNARNVNVNNGNVNNNNKNNSNTNNRVRAFAELVSNRNILIKITYCVLIFFFFSIKKVMKTTQLPVFRKTLDLVIIIKKLVKKFPKEDKYDIGSELKITSLKLFKHLFKANRMDVVKEERVKCLNDFLDDFDLLKVLIRISNEERLFSIKDAANLAIITENISRQITGWRNKYSSNDEGDLENEV